MYVPAFSVLALVCVILAVMVFAAIEIHSGGDDETSVQMMLIFASINVVVDIVCIAIFYFRQDVILFSRPAKEGTGEPKASPTPQTNSTNTNTNTNTMFNSANLNMFAAFTHVGSDTLRTLAIFLAVLAAKTTSARSSVCDAWAAVAVSVTIFVAVLPLSREIYHAYLGVR